MMSVEEAIRKRRSTRRFRPEPISREHVLQMLEAARLAPSASNLQPWRFVVVTDATEKRRLRELCLDQAFIEEAAVVFVACADLSRYSRAATRRRYQEILEAQVELSGRFADPRYQGLMDSIPEPEQRAVRAPATANTYIATEHIVLTATALGLGSCWVGGITDHQAIKELLGIPEHMLVVALVAVGYPAQAPPPRPRLPLEEILLRPLPQGL